MNKEVRGDQFLIYVKKIVKILETYSLRFLLLNENIMSVVQVSYWSHGPGSLISLKEVGGQVYHVTGEEVSLRTGSLDPEVILYIEDTSPHYIKSCRKDSLLGRFIMTSWKEIKARPKLEDIYLGESEIERLKLFGKLVHLSIQWRGTWIPDWTSVDKKYVICRHQGKVIVDRVEKKSFPLCFETEEIATKFLNTYSNEISKIQKYL